MLLPNLIRTRLGKGPEFLRKTSAGILLVRRWLVQASRSDCANAKILFIFGCQRSGTTLLSRIFEGDPLVCSYAEHSKALAREDHRLRTRSLNDLERIFKRCRGHLVVSKPLVESQRATVFLDHFPGSMAIWSYRHYREVVRSFVNLFDQAGVNIMRKIVDRVDNWASESVSDESRAIVERFYRPDMALNDAAALFWFVRNALYFDQGLDADPRVLTCEYGRLVSQPDSTMRRIYAHVDLTYPGEHLIGGIHEESRGLGNSLVFDPEIEELCETMWRRLSAVSDRFETAALRSLPPPRQSVNEV